jgi:hypothetical protein
MFRTLLITNENSSQRGEMLLLLFLVNDHVTFLKQRMPCPKGEGCDSGTCFADR